MISSTVIYMFRTYHCIFLLLKLSSQSVNQTLHVWKNLFQIYHCLNTCVESSIQSWTYANDILHNFHFIPTWECVLKASPQTIKLSQDILYFCHQTTLKLPSQNLQILYTSQKIVLWSIEMLLRLPLFNIYIH